MKALSSARTSGPIISEWSAHHPVPGLEIWQPEGFRYSADAFWLAGFALEEASGRTALDLGTGSGIVAFLLARQGWRVRGVDDEPTWQTGWERSLLGSEVVTELQVEDVREVTGRFDLVTSNPPYFPAGTGPAPPDPLRAAAHTEGSARLEHFIEAAARVLTPTGTAAFIVPSQRVHEVIHPMLHVRRRTFVGRKRVLCGLSRAPGPCVEHHLDRDGAQRFYPQV